MNAKGQDGVRTALECEELTKRFGGLEAVKQVNLRVEAGERRAIIGPNGAGKTTLFSLISGLYPVTTGRIRIFGKEITHVPSHRRTALGLGRTFQITNLFPTLSVIENLVIAAMGMRGMKFQMVRPLSTYREIYQRALEGLEKVGMAGKQGELVKNLSYGEQRQIEVTLALISNPVVLLLDEPTAGLSPADSAMMAEMIHNLDPADYGVADRAQHGRGVAGGESDHGAAFGGSVCGGESRGDPEQYGGSGDLLWSRGMRGERGEEGG